MGVDAEPAGMPSVSPIVKAETLTVHIPITRRTARMTGIIFFIIHPPKNKIKGHFIWYILYLYKSSRHGDFNNRPEVRRLLRITRPGRQEGPINNEITNAMGKCCGQAANTGQG